MNEELTLESTGVDVMTSCMVFSLDELSIGLHLKSSLYGTNVVKREHLISNPDDDVKPAKIKIK